MTGKKQKSTAPYEAILLLVRENPNLTALELWIKLKSINKNKDGAKFIKEFFSNEDQEIRKICAILVEKKLLSSRQRAGSILIEYRDYDGVKNKIKNHDDTYKCGICKKTKLVKFFPETRNRFRSPECFSCKEKIDAKVEKK